MSALRIEDVVTLDCILSRSPLVLGLSPRRVRGADAVMLWCLYAQLMPRGAIKSDRSRGFDVRELVVTRIDARIARGIEQAIQRELEAVMFVAAARVRVALLDGGESIAIDEEITLINGRSYPLAVTIDEAGAALRRLGP